MNGEVNLQIDVLIVNPKVMHWFSFACQSHTSGLLLVYCTCFTLVCLVFFTLSPFHLCVVVHLVINFLAHDISMLFSYWVLFYILLSCEDP